MNANAKAELLDLVVRVGESVKELQAKIAEHEIRDAMDEAVTLDATIRIIHSHIRSARLSQGERP